MWGRVLVIHSGGADDDACISEHAPKKICGWSFPNVLTMVLVRAIFLFWNETYIKGYKEIT